MASIGQNCSNNFSNLAPLHRHITHHTSHGQQKLLCVAISLLFIYVPIGLVFSSHWASGVRKLYTDLMSCFFLRVPSYETQFNGVGIRHVMSFTARCRATVPNHTRICEYNLLLSLSLFKIFVLFYVLFVLCRSVYCLCVNVYCTAATGWLPNFS